MGDSSLVPSDEDEGEDGEEGEEAEGDDDDEGSPENENSPSKLPQEFTPAPDVIPTIGGIPDLSTPDIKIGDSELDDSPLADMPKRREEGKSGSPLKNVAMTTSSLTSPLASPITPSASVAEPAPAEYLEPVAEAAEQAAIEEVTQEIPVVTAPEMLPVSEPAGAPEDAVTEAQQSQEEEEEEMLLDLVENIDGDPTEAETQNSEPEQPADPVPIPETENIISVPTLVDTITQDANAEPAIAVEEMLVELVQAEAEVAIEEEEEFLDLLGGLERSLNRADGGVADAPASASTAVEDAGDQKVDAEAPATATDPAVEEQGPGSTEAGEENQVTELEPEKKEEGIV
jgi:hypothetical protein